MNSKWVRRETYDRAKRLYTVIEHNMAAAPNNVTSALLTDYYNCKDIIAGYQNQSRVPFDTVIGIQETFRRHKVC